MEKLNLHTREGRETLRQRQAAVRADLEQSVRERDSAAVPALNAPADDFAGCEQIPPGLDQLPDHKWPSPRDERQPYWVEN